LAKTQSVFLKPFLTQRRLDIIQRHGLRGIISGPLLKPGTLDVPEEKAKLDALVEGVRDHPALYGYHLKDEPNASTFPDLARLKAYLDERDPARLKYVNLFPNYATAEQLGTEGQPTHALVVNLDYRTYSGRGRARRDEFLEPVARSIMGPSNLEVFDAATSEWSDSGGDAVALQLPPSGPGL
jgi:hypothetical protein